jgi:hypothetical protein
MWKARVEADIIRATTRPTTTQATRPHPVIDRQLDQALKILKAEVNLVSADPTRRNAG